ncbi:MAG: CocE/NonD family hydrolase [Planctomycetota bacterium]|nr:MAG: CocE/NonD family hydrolase [Planctomycetota bacterium]
MSAKWLARVDRLCLIGLVLLVTQGAVLGQSKESAAKYIREHYTKQECRIPMRDGAKLFTVVYAPKETSQRSPMLMVRTPYGVGPYEKDKFRDNLGPNRFFEKEGYIFVYQDVRGCYLSEGRFVNMRPHLDKKESKKDIDESSDTYDTIEWLLANIPNHNGKIGLWGISYPGFYASAGMIDAHPALKAVSPQAPIADWFFDDFRHHGAFFLPHAFNFMAVFGQPRPEPTSLRIERFDHKTPDGYQFFMDLGPLKNANTKYFKDRVTFWNRLAEHPNYDAFWQARNLLPHLKKVAPAVMTVGGWFDAEDLYGALNTYQTIEQQNPDIFNMLVMGPWQHGGWSRSDGERLGNIHFGAKTGLFYQKDMELAFFDHFLRASGDPKLPEAYMFETGANRWRRFDHWPPKNLQKKTLYFHAGGRLSFNAPSEDSEAHDEYVSDPNKPVPFTEVIATGMTTEYMTDDQRFAARRPDVLTCETEPLKNDVTLAGPLLADLRVSTSGTDSDWIVKLIDVFPDDAQDYPNMRPGEHLGGYQMMVRSEVIRGRFRNSYEKPEPFTPNQATRVPLKLQDVLHTFAKGHRIMVQVQSTWFPLVDRNPQKYVDNIFLADEKDFVKATQRVYRNKQQPTSLQVGVLPPE